MKKYEILYDWPFAEIQRLADSGDAENYAVALSPVPLASFTTLTEQMRGLGADLASAKAARQHFLKWNELNDCLELFEQEFSNFPGASLRKFRLFILLADKLTQAAPPLDALDVDETAFEIRELPRPLPFSWFSYENAQSQTDSMAVFACGDLATLQVEVATWNLSPTFMFYLLAALHVTPILPAAHAVVVKKAVQPIDIAAIEAFVHMIVLAKGKSLHSARRYLNAPHVINPDSIRAGHIYQQWTDVLNVLSEYNNRDEVLIKYLTIYHVIENFMFKLPIVELERQQNGSMFSIRDFKRLYKKLDMAESNALKQLLTVAFAISMPQAAAFKQHIIARWGTLIQAIPQLGIDGALNTLGMTFQHNHFNSQTAIEFFSKIVYSVRNAIVHNKETEFHLTYASLDAPMCALIEDFLIPSLEEICFAIIGSPNLETWYKNKELLLYK